MKCYTFKTKLAKKNLLLLNLIWFDLRETNLALLFELDFSTKGGHKTDFKKYP